MKTRILMPDPRLFTNLLNDYLYVRQFHWNSWNGWFESWYWDPASIKTGTCTLINEKFYNEDRSFSDKLKTAEGWVELFCYLGSMGRSQSFISATNHAIRTYGLAKIKETEEENIPELI